jgi:hypothetical protein
MVVFLKSELWLVYHNKTVIDLPLWKPEGFGLPQWQGNLLQQESGNSGSDKAASSLQSREGNTTNQVRAGC